MGYKVKRFSAQQEKCTEEMLERAKKEGVVQQAPDGSWRIVSVKKGTLWTPHYKTKESGLKALAAYHIRKGG